MSENSERSADDTETETKATMEDLPDNSSKSEAKLMMNRTDAALLEDEEMPTYISVSSTSRCDDSEVVNVKQQENELHSIPQEVEEEPCQSPYASDDQAASSVYVLSSEEETDHHAFNDEDDEDEYADSEEMENMELNKFHPGGRQMNHLIEEEEDDEDDEDEEEDEEGFRQMHNDDDDDDDMDSSYERNWNDRRSDDFLLNKRLKNQDKEKSLSLQDLNAYRNNDYMGYSRRQYPQNIKQNYLNIPQNAVTYSMVHKKQSLPAKYNVESKVKQYIKEMREQDRRSMERLVKHHEEDAIHNKNSNEIHENNDAKRMESTMTNKKIKDYAERTIKELEIAEVYDRNKAYNVTSVMLNGQDNRNGLEPVHEESVQNEVQITVPFEQTQDETDPLSADDKMQKQNGTVEIKPLKFSFPERNTSHFDAMQPCLIQNGHQEEPTVLYNLQDAVNYREYVQNSSSKTDLNRNAHVIQQEQIQHEMYNNAEPIDVDNDTTCTLRIENIKSIRTIADEAKSNEQTTFDKMNEGRLTTPTSDALEIVALKDQLNRKTVQYNDLHDAYEKQLAENLRMKQELDELKESLAKYKKESKPLEQKVVSIQTDIDDSTHKHDNQTEPTNVKQSNNKISNSSVALTLSSIEQWSDNLSISMKPPEATKALHSDDSMVLTDDTPRRTARPLSRAFVTSSRILQTLASITQGKTKPESPLVQNSKKRLNDSTAMDSQNDDNSYQNRSSNFKKRKIGDIPGTSNLQSFKASDTTAESNLKLNETSVQSQYKHSFDLANEMTQLQEGSSNINASYLGTATSTTESKVESTDDPEDVKCFVYRENENSKDRSFLILAQEPKTDKTVNEKGRVRECGPYLLGNMEVRMSEINGTINIWGKEISQESTAETENETETSAKVKDNKKHHCWQNTPHTRYNGSNLVCSTSKKSKVSPKFELSPAAFNFSHVHSSSFNTAKPSCSTDRAYADNVHSASPCVSSCENCDSSKNHSKEWMRCKRTPQEKLHTCCVHNVDMLEQKFNCSLHEEKQQFEDNFNCSREKSNTKERSSFSRNMEPNKHLYENINPTAEDEFACRHHTACRQSLYDHGENYQESHKCCNMSREACMCKQPSMSIDRECSNHSCNHLSPNLHEEEPLIGLKQNIETPETRRRRLIGKRVRGILKDLIRGCGDCYNPNTSTSNKGCIHKKEFNSMNCSPRIKITPCASPEPSCSNREHDHPAGRCCHAYAKRIESQLEEFRVEMERVRTRSSVILDMLNMLQAVDPN